MEGDHRQYELRSGSRSRSTTPSVQNRVLTESESTEHHYDLRRRSRERSRTPGEVTSTRRSGSRSLPGSIGKVREHSMETIVEKREESHGEKLEGTVSAGSKKAERRSERQKAKRQIFVNGQSESKEDSSAQMNETLNLLECKETIPRALVTSDYSSEEGEREDIPSRPGSAYEIYKQAGDWWNVFPKTDYTYSEKSQCRYEIAPGVLAMPNMSRRPIHSNDNSTLRSASPVSEQKLFHSTQETFDSGLGDTLNTRQSQERSSQSRSSMSESYETLPKSRNWDSAPKSAVYTKTHIEQYKCHREVIYTVPGSSAAVRQRQSSYGDIPSTRSIESSSRRFAVTSDTIDSDTEFEEAISTSVNTLDRRWRITGWFLKFRTFVFLWIGKLFGLLNFRSTDIRRQYRTSYEYERYHGIGHESKWSRLGRHIDHSLQYVYLLMVQIFFFDSWLLSRVSNVRRTLQERGPKVLWIALLPLLLLIACWCLLPPLATSFFSSELVTPEIRHHSTSNERAILFEESLSKIQELKSLIDWLRTRIDLLEEGNVEQTEHLSNFSRTVEDIQESDTHRWTKYDDKILALEKRLDSEILSNAHARDIESIKLEFEALKALYSQLKSCCNARMEFFTNDELQTRIERVVSGYFGATPPVSKIDITRILQKLQVAEFTEEESKTLREGTHSEVTEARIHEIVKEAIKTYDADKTGRVDYALESAGGQIISTRCTQRYDGNTRAFKLLSFTLYHENNNPRTVIQGNLIQPGTCWAFQGFPGYLLIKLRSFIYVTGFTLEHAAKSILPNSEMKSAPRKFNVWGFTDENDPEPMLFGDYEFLSSGDSLQYFPVQNTLITKPYEYVELRVHSNHGQLEYTCLYRFRVHGRSV